MGKIMQRLTIFNNVSLDGFFTGPNGDLSWTNMNKQDEESKFYAAENAKGGGVLIFGRITYELMAGYWPTPLASKNDPVIAEHINKLPKVVFSRTLDQVSWNNTKLVRGNLVAEIRKMKKENGKGMAILGSGSIVSQLVQEDLIDEYQFMVNPVILGQGKTLFDGIKKRLTLKLTRTFNNGNILLCYEPLRGM
jgi:dihydrofolate reductase